MLSKAPTSFEQLGLCGSINNISYHLLNVHYVSNMSFACIIPFHLHITYKVFIISILWMKNVKLRAIRSKWWNWDLKPGICLSRPCHPSLWYAQTFLALRDHSKSRFGERREEMVIT